MTTSSQPSIQQRIARSYARIDRLMQPFADRLAEDADILDGDWEINVPADDSDLEGKTSKSAERTRERRALARASVATLYRLDDIEARPISMPVYLCSAHADADKLVRLGALATAVQGGNWPADLSALKGRRVYLLSSDIGDGRLDVAALEKLNNIADVVPLHINGSVSTWIANLGTQERLMELSGVARPASIPKAANDNADLPFINPADWFGKPVPERKWFIPGLIPSRTVTILNGDGGVGKSLFGLQIGMGAAGGFDTAGLSPEPGRVLYLGAEDEAEEFQRRMTDIATAHGRTLESFGDFRLVPMADRDALLSIPNKAGVMEPTAVWHRLAEKAREFKPRFIVLDTSADLYGGDEIKRAQVRGFVAMLRGLAMELDAAILLLSHPSLTGITSGSGSSGSTAWNNSVRSRLYLTVPAGMHGEEPDPKQRTLSVMKANYGETGATHALRWQAGVFIPEVDVSPILRNAAANRADALFLDLLARMEQQGQNVSATPGTNYAPKRMADHADAVGTTKRQFALAMQRLMDGGKVKIEVSGPKSRQRQRLVVLDSTNPSTSLPPPYHPPTTSLAYHPPIPPHGVEAPPEVESSGASPAVIAANDNVPSVEAANG
ncbi:MAG: AAA family ATPase [Cypionkella sp.]